MIKSRVLIAEDEPLVARFIRQIVDAIDQVETVFVCKSGEEACQFIQTESVEILITDIHMHGMNGLELIAKAKIMKPDLQVIVVSGYSLFAYAKEALRLGVEDYLLKPIDPDELTRNICNIHSFLQRQNNERMNIVLKRLLRAEDYEAIGTLFAGDRISALFVNQSGDPESTLELCLSTISELQETEMNVALWNRSVLILCASDMGADPFFTLRQLLRSRAETSTLELLCTKSPMEKSALSECLPAMYRMSREERILGQTVEHFVQPDHMQPVTAKRKYEKFPDSLLSGNPIQMKAAYKKLFSVWEQEQFSVRELRAALFSLLNQMNHRNLISDRLSAASEDIAECLKYADSFAQACDTSWDIIESALSCSNLSQDDNRIDLKSLFQSMDSFLQSHCSQNYSLQDLSQRYHVCQPYISRAFRTYTGMTYKEYCIHQNISLAKDLISSHPNKTFKEIAQSVGIDPSYFGTVFHRITGEYPSEFKSKSEAAR